MESVQKLISKIESVVEEHQNKKPDSEIKNYLFLIKRKDLSHGVKKHRQHEPLNETHQLSYHFSNNSKLAPYVYEDEDETSHVKRSVVSTNFPKDITYRAFITSILDVFWTPYDKFHSTTLLEGNMEMLFKELNVDTVVFDGTIDLSIRRLGNSSKSFNKLIQLLNNRFNVSVIFIAKKEDGSVINYNKLNIEKSFSFMIEDVL